MDNQLFTGKLTRLANADPDKIGELFAKWSRDSEFQQLWDADVPMIRDVKQTQESFRKDFEKERPGNYGFMIQRLEDDRFIGMVGLWHAETPHRNAFVSIGIGERELWGKGYGTDAMNLILRYGFLELNLRRVTLDTFSNNPRAIRAYEKVGFVHEGVIRGAMKRNNQRRDFIFMGISRQDWEKKNQEETSRNES